MNRCQGISRDKRGRNDKQIPAVHTMTREVWRGRVDAAGIESREDGWSERERERVRLQ